MKRKIKFFICVIIAAADPMLAYEMYLALLPAAIKTNTVDGLGTCLFATAAILFIAAVLLALYFMDNDHRLPPPTGAIATETK